MKKLLFPFFLLIVALTTITAQDNYTLTINFKGLKSDKGNLFIAVYNKENNFLKKNYKGDVVKIIDRKAIVVFKGLPNGEYAISAFHDENDNKKMDTNFIGIPNEPLGTSNNAKGFMGPPEYKDAKFTLTKNTNITITMD